MALKKFQQQLSKNRGKTTVLGALTVVLAVMGFKAFQSMQPQRASAMSPPRNTPAADGPRAADSELDKHARESLALWNLLREKRGLEADVAYHFDPTYYNLDPARQREHDPVIDRMVIPVPEKSGGKSTDQQIEQSHEAHIRDLARSFVLQTTILGPEPKALISVGGNAQVVHLGETINGFKIIAIDGRMVQIQKEGVTLGLKMAE
jgi:hypothetical protein